MREFSFGSGRRVQALARVRPSEERGGRGGRLSPTPEPPPDPAATASAPDARGEVHARETAPPGPARDRHQAPTLVQAGPGAALPSGAAAEGARIGGYRLVRELGRGGMGVVWLAHAEALDRPVALKVLGPRAAAVPQLVERFQLEARAVARMQHPNVVGIHQVGEEGGAPFLVMDLVEGRSLAARLQEQGPLPPREAARIAAALARALAYAHARAILHRDLKPGNVLLRPDGTPVLTDFGLARDLSEEGGPTERATREGDVLGTPAYMPPEQARGRPDLVDRRADVYGLGATLYELLTGRPPFEGASAGELLARVLRDDPLPPSRLCAGLDRDLETIVLRCLEKEPEARYPGMPELADDLERWLAERPILTRRAGPLERARKWVRRNRSTARALGLLALVGALLSAAAGSVFVSELRLARDQALGASQEARRALASAEQAQHAAESAGRSAAAETARARVQADLTRAALAVLVREVRDALGEVPGARARAARERLLEHARQGYERLAASLGEEASPEQVLEVQRELGRLAYDQGRLEDSVAALRRALEAARRRPGPDDGEARALLVYLGESLHALGRLDQAEAAWREALALSGDGAAEDARRVTQGKLAQALRWRGDLEGARGLLLDALGDEGYAGTVFGAASGALLAEVELMRGDVAASTSAARAAMATAERLRGSEGAGRRLQSVAARAQQALAEALWASRDHEGALAALAAEQGLLHQLLREDPGDFLPLIDLLRAGHTQGEVLLELGRVGEARRVVDETLEATRRLPVTDAGGFLVRVARGALSTLRAAVAEAEGDPAGACRALDQALEVLRPAAGGGHLAVLNNLCLALQRRGRLAREQGDLVGAAAALDEALLLTAGHPQRELRALRLELLRERAVAHGRAREPANAGPLLEEQVTLARELLAEAPADPQQRGTLAYSLLVLSGWLAEEGQPERAEALVRECLALRLALRDERPGEAGPQGSLIGALVRLHELLLRREAPVAERLELARRLAAEAGRLVELDPAGAGEARRLLDWLHARYPELGR